MPYCGSSCILNQIRRRGKRGGIIKFTRKLRDLKGIKPEEAKELEKVTEKYEFKINEYYKSLINFNDPADPLRRLVIPDMHELDTGGVLDPSNESKYTKMQGLQHKYPSTALLLVSTDCAGICRYCFRKRIFMRRGGDGVKDYKAAFGYIRKHTEIQNVLLTGGDPLQLSTAKLASILRELRAINHVGIIRIGTKMAAFYPDRIIEDKKLLALIKRYSTKDKRIYIMTHFDHVREITPKAVKAASMLIGAGAILANQTPIITGINDKPEVLADLFTKLSYIGISPYYVFQCRPTSANMAYAVPLERSYVIFEKARTMVSGLAKTARLVMSTSAGKIHVIGLTDKEIILKFFRAAKHSDSGRLMIFKRNKNAYWLDDYSEVKKDIKLFKGLDKYGPD